MIKRVFGLLLCICLVFAYLPAQSEAEGIDNDIAGVVNFYRENARELSDWSSNWWDIVALRGAGEDIKSDGYSLPQWKADFFPEKPQILDYVHFIFAGKALGYNPENLDGRNLLSELAAKQKNDGFFGGVINFHIWSMITLDVFDYPYNKETALDRLLEMQLEDGSFPSPYGTGDTDITAMALIALSSHSDRDTVSNSVYRAVDYIKTKQTPTGGFEGLNGENANTTAITISGLVDAGEDIFSEKWSIDGKTPLDGLMSYRLSSNAFCFTTDNPEPNLMATSQALGALQDIMHNKSIFKRIKELGQEDEGSDTEPFPTSTPSPDADTESGDDSQQRYVYLKVTGDDEKGIIYERNRVLLNSGDTPYTVLKRELGDITVSGSGDDVYVRAINGLAEFDKGPVSGWKYTVNSEEPQIGAGKYLLAAEDEVHWFYFWQEETGQGTNSDGPDDRLSKSDDNKKDGKKSFADIDNASSWALPYIERAQKYGIINGDPNGKINPDAYITRAEFTTMIIKAQDIQASESYEEIYDDVKKSDWHFNYIMAAYQNGYIKGKSADSFEPDAFITREEMAVILSRLIQSSNEDKIPEDMEQVSAWATEAVRNAFSSGIMQGDGVYFYPKDFATREMAIKIIVMIYEWGK